MNRRCPGLQLHPEGPALSDDLRLFQLHLPGGGHDHAVARGFHGSQCVGDFVVLLLDFRQLHEKGQKLGLAFDRYSGLAAENFIVQRLRQGNDNAHNALRQVDCAQSVALHLG